MIVEEEAEVIALGVQDVENVLGRSLPLLVLRNKVMDILVKNEEFSRLSHDFLHLTLDCFKISSFKAGEKISSSNCIFLVLEGSYKLSSPQEASVVVYDNSPQNKRLYGSISSEKNSHQVSFITPSKIAMTTKQEILKAFESTYEEAIEKKFGHPKDSGEASRLTE